jgi:hypothetical protein
MSDLISLFSGYGSQAVSSTNLSSEDSMSIRSISVDETPDVESRAVMLVEQLQTVSEISGHLGEEEGDATDKMNWKHSLVERISAAVKNETQTNSDAQKMAAQKPIKMLHQTVGNLDVTGGPSLMQNTSLAEEKQILTSTLPDRNSLSLELTNRHTNNLGNINDSSQNESVGLMESSSVSYSMNEGCNKAQQAVEDAIQHTSSNQDCGVSTTESPTSDNQCEVSRIAAYDSMFTSPLEETHILAETESLSSKTVSSPEPVSTSVTNSGDDESPYEGTSVVHTHLPPGKV